MSAKGPQRELRRRPWLRRTLLAAAAFASFAAPLALGQTQGADFAAVVKVVLADGRTRDFTRAELQQLPTESAAARLRDGVPFTASGVSVTTLLRLSGLDLSANLGGGTVVGHALIARAADGYKAVFALAEVDPHFGHAPVLVNWANVDGSALPARVGPLQLISTGESRPGRWVRQLTTLEVKALP
jgi:hypothetical protein